MMKKIFFWLSTIILTLILSYFVGMYFYPEEISKGIGYQFYEQQSTSMQPRIPSNSLVLIKRVDQKTAIKPNTMIVFKAHSKKDEQLLLRHFKTTQKSVEGNVIYRTVAEGKKSFDIYETSRQDIVGTYVAHAPYLAKTYHFLQSVWGMVMQGALLAIIIIIQIVKLYLRKSKAITLSEEIAKPREEIVVQCIHEIVKGQFVELQGNVLNETKNTIYFLRVKILLEDESRRVLDSNLWYLVGKEGLPAGQEKQWTCTIALKPEITKYRFEIVSYK